MARRNDDEFVAFASARQAQLRRTAYLMCGDWQLAADIVQEALIRVYVAWPRLERKGGLPSYARKAVVSVAIDMARKRSYSEIPAPDGEGLASAADHAAGHAANHAADHASAVSDRHALMAALTRLPDRQRACVVLRYFDDLPVGEVAALLGCSDGTVKSQTSRALRSLQSMFKARGAEELVVSREAGESW